MAGKKRLGLISKFNMLTITLILVTSLGIATFVIYQGSTTGYKQLIRHGISIAATVAQNSEYALYTENQEALLQIVQSLSVNPEVAYVAVLNQEKQTLVSTVVYPDVSIPFPIALEKKDTETQNLSESFVNEADGKRYIDIVAPVVSLPSEETSELFLEFETTRQKPQAIGYIQVGLSLEGLHKRVWSFLYSTLSFVSFFGLFGVLITILMTRRIVSPFPKRPKKETNESVE